MTTTVTTKLQQRRKFLLVLPLFVLPAFFIVFHALGGGKGDQQQLPEKEAGMGFNMELPPAIFDKKDEKMDKLAFYKRADDDSIRKRLLQLQDPNRNKSIRPNAPLQNWPGSDARADTLLRRLDVLKRKVAEPPVIRTPMQRMQTREQEIREPVAFPSRKAPELVKQASDTEAIDPELEKLNVMLDKIARLQQGAQPERGIMPIEKPLIKKDDTVSSAVLAIPAIVDKEQELVNGATIALRLTSGVCYNGMIIRQGQLVYGVVNLSNDRMQVVIRSILCGQSILATDWQVYDMDGLAGIHIPDGLGRQAAKQSADQSLGSLNLSAYDPSLGAQVANAGIQTARNFFSRKVRSIRVTVPAGYQVLLKGTKTTGGTLQLLRDTLAVQSGDTSKGAGSMTVPPAVDSLQPYLHKSVSEGKVTLTLKGIYPYEGLVWLYLTVRNESAFPYVPQYLHLSIRQGKHVKRMATQEMPVKPLYESMPSIVKVGNEQVILVGMRNFVLAKDKKLVLRVDERELNIGRRIWSKARSL